MPPFMRTTSGMVFASRRLGLDVIHVWVDWRVTGFNWVGDCKPRRRDGGGRTKNDLISLLLTAVGNKVRICAPRVLTGLERRRPRVMKTGIGDRDWFGTGSTQVAVWWGRRGAPRWNGLGGVSVVSVWFGEHPGLVWFGEHPGWFGEHPGCCVVELGVFIWTKELQARTKGFAHVGV